MDDFLAWFADTSPVGRKPLPALTRAAIAHLYFVCIHPFEDGNGRIGRAVAEKALAENLQRPTLIALSQSIEKPKRVLSTFRDQQQTVRRNQMGHLFRATCTRDLQDLVAKNILLKTGTLKAQDITSTSLTQKALESLFQLSFRDRS